MEKEKLLEFIKGLDEADYERLENIIRKDVLDMRVPIVKDVRKHSTEREVIAYAALLERMEEL